MSYILEALMQSEQARREGAAAERYSLLPPVGDAAPAQRPWHYALLTGLLLVNAGALYPRLQPPPASEAMRTEPPPLPAAPRAGPPARPPELANLAARTDAAPVPARRSSPRAAAPADSPATAVSPAPAPPAEAARAPAAPAAEMPVDIRKQLPALAVAGYIRNAAADEMVIVNDKLLRAGDEIEPGLKLEKIADDGLVFSFKGYRFKR